MAMPLTESAFTPTDWDLFLDEIGFVDQSPESREEMIEQALEAVQYAFTTKLFRQLPSDQRIEMVKLLDDAETSGNYEPVNDLLVKVVPDPEGLIDEIIEGVKEQYRKMAAGLPEMIARQVAKIQEIQALEEQSGKEIFANQTGSELPELHRQYTETPPAVPEATPDTPSTREPFPWEATAVDPSPTEPFPWETPVIDSASIAEEPVLTTHPSEPPFTPFPWEAAATDQASLAQQPTPTATPPSEPPATPFPWEAPVDKLATAQAPADPLAMITPAVTDTAEDQPASSGSSSDAIQDELNAL